MAALWLIAALLAQPAPQPAPPPQQAKAETRPPLSEEDRELVKELALLEQMELVRNLELFEAEKDDPKPAPQRQP
jgi:hypothetical protein